jgi:hypothetical protein
MTSERWQKGKGEGGHKKGEGTTTEMDHGVSSMVQMLTG